MKIIFNGQLLDPSDPQVQVSPFGPAVEYGYSVFETFVVRQGRVPGSLNAHWERLFKSADHLKLQLLPSLNAAALDQGLAQLLSNLDLSQDYRVKVLANQQWWWLRAQVLVALPDQIYQQGVVVDDATVERLFPQAKAPSVLYPYFMAHQSQTGSFETLFFNVDDQLLEGNVSSVVAVINGQLLSPASDVLPGVTVRQVFECAQAQGLVTEFCPITRAQLQSATEIFVVNAVRGIVPVRQWGEWQRTGTEVYEQVK